MIKDPLAKNNPDVQSKKKSNKLDINKQLKVLISNGILIIKSETLLT